MAGTKFIFVFFSLKSLARGVAPQLLTWSTGEVVEEQAADAAPLSASWQHEVRVAARFELAVQGGGRGGTCIYSDSNCSRCSSVLFLLNFHLSFISFSARSCAFACMAQRCFVRVANGLVVLVKSNSVLVNQIRGGQVSAPTKPT
jgi:hypothetical protein